MARWLVEYLPGLNCHPDDPAADHELPRFRIFPEGEPDRWIVRTNENLPLEVQEEAAAILAQALSKALG
jgi:hypothetical protein